MKAGATRRRKTEPHAAPAAPSRTTPSRGRTDNSSRFDAVEEYPPRRGRRGGDSRDDVRSHDRARNGRFANDEAASGGRSGRSGGRRDSWQDAVPAERLQKILARSGLGSRRQVDEWVAAGDVVVNNAVAVPGQKVGPADRVKVRGRLVRLKFASRVPRVLLYHKPEGEIVSRSDPEGRPTIFQRLPLLRKGRWIAVGRLDFNTSGLLILTDDGDLANRLMHPSANIDREYAVRVLGQLTDEQMTQLKNGVQLEDGLAKFDTLLDAGGEGVNHWYRVTLSEGRNREVRRMFEAGGLVVSRLIRVRYGPLHLPSRLKRGMWMALTEEEAFRLTGETPPEGYRVRQRTADEKRREQKMHRTRPAARGRN